ncbi:MAG TPA: argininosuccinate lyase [Dehalococcoidia bacterium]
MLRAGRFARGMDPLVEEYTASIDQDAALLPFDIEGSRAHAAMLGQQGIIPGADAAAIERGLSAIAADAESGVFRLRPEQEDVHNNVEAELERRVGAAAGRLHTARSRNDQVVNDFRMLVRDTADMVGEKLHDLAEVLVNLAEAHIDTVMPGYTHLQLAQPVLLAHHLMAYFQMFSRDAERFWAVSESANVLALGSGALAGLPYPLDRDFTANELGFDRVSPNSMDAVSDRDFVLEFHAAAAICMMHISRLSEEIILWSTREFGFITLDDAYSTGSSIMPQKKNPDIAELARGRTALVYGNMVSAFALMKALPLTYNRDLQDDKGPFLHTVGLLVPTLEIFAAMLPTITWHKERLREAAAAGYSLATDIADFLVRKGLPFRQAHEIVGRLVRYAIEQEKDFADLTLDEYRQFSDLFDQSVLKIDLETAIDGRNTVGGTARQRVREQIATAREWLNPPDIEEMEALFAQAAAALQQPSGGGRGGGGRKR